MKQKIVRVGIAILVLGVIWSVFSIYNGERLNKRFGLKVSLENLTPKDATIIIECSNEIEDEGFTIWSGGYRMERWTPIGWR